MLPRMDAERGDLLYHNRGEGGWVDAGWAFTVARGWGCGRFNDEPAFTGNPPPGGHEGRCWRMTVRNAQGEIGRRPQQGEDKPSPWSGVARVGPGQGGHRVAIACANKV